MGRAGLKRVTKCVKSGSVTNSKNPTWGGSTVRKDSSSPGQAGSARVGRCALLPNQRRKATATFATHLALGHALLATVAQRRERDGKRLFLIALRATRAGTRPKRLAREQRDQGTSPGPSCCR